MDASGRGEGGGGIWWLAAAGAIAVLCVPFFMVDAPPVLDYPNHLARLYVLAFGASDPALSAMYAPHWSIVPNLVLDILGPPLMHVLPVSIAGRMLLALSALLPVAGVVLYHRAVFGGRSYWPLAASLVAFNGLFFLGFMNFLYAVGVAFAVAGVWIRWSERRPLVAVPVAMAGVVMIFFCHLIGVLLFALLIGTHELAALASVRAEPARLLRCATTRGLLVVLVLGPAFVLYLQSPLAGVSGGLLWETLDRKIAHIFTPFLTYDLGVTLATAVAVVAIVALVWRRASVDAGSALAFVILAAVYVVAPRHMKSGAVIDARLPVMMAFLVFGGLRPALSQRAALALAAVASVVLVARTATIAAAWHDHRRDLAELRETWAPVEPGAKVLVLTAAITAGDAYRDAEPVERSVPWLYRTDEHLPGLMLIERHAFWPQLFADPLQQPLAVRPPYDAFANPLGEPPDYRVLQSDTPADPARPAYLDHWTEFDYVLLLDAGAIDVASLRPDRLQLVSSSDMAALYRVKRP